MQLTCLFRETASQINDIVNCHGFEAVFSGQNHASWKQRSMPGWRE
jgi:hypothetical protein